MVNSFVFMKPYAMDVISTGLQIGTAHCRPIPEDAAPAPPVPLRGHCSPVSSPGMTVLLRASLFSSFMHYSSYCVSLLAFVGKRFTSSKSTGPCGCRIHLFLPLFSYTSSKRKAFILVYFCESLYRVVSYKQAIQDANASLEDKKKEI